MRQKTDKHPRRRAFIVLNICVELRLTKYDV